jgi:hypothetical protein
MANIRKYPLPMKTPPQVVGADCSRKGFDSGAIPTAPPRKQLSSSPDYRGWLCSLQGIKIHFREFLYDFALKRNKLP